MKRKLALHISGLLTVQLLFCSVASLTRYFDIQQSLHLHEGIDTVYYNSLRERLNNNRFNTIVIFCMSQAGILFAFGFYFFFKKKLKEIPTLTHWLVYIPASLFLWIIAFALLFPRVPVGQKYVESGMIWDILRLILRTERHRIFHKASTSLKMYEGFFGCSIRPIHQRFVWPQ